MDRSKTQEEHDEKNNLDGCDHWLVSHLGRM